MVRNCQRKTQPVDKQALSKAIEAVKGHVSIFKAAKQFKLNYETLHTHVHRAGLQEIRPIAHKSVNKSKLDKAICAVKAGRSIQKAAEIVKLNYQTLRSSIERPMPTKYNRQVGIFESSFFVTE
ncbi:hypothetical protein ABEB36_009525 [Hypothenemus hampei]|uniref:HTH psq-type domain-containing protein n=1 Tax=Hypothenemus hampei TaxID=57062 RepID=A0ABD1EGN7_HYPHA